MPPSSSTSPVAEGSGDPSTASDVGPPVVVGTVVVGGGGGGSVGPEALMSSAPVSVVLRSDAQAVSATAATTATKGPERGVRSTQQLLGFVAIVTNFVFASRSLRTFRNRIRSDAG